MPLAPVPAIGLSVPTVHLRPRKATKPWASTSAITRTAVWWWSASRAPIALHMDFGELDPEPAYRLDQIVEAAEGLDFIVVIHQEKTAPGAFLEKYDPLPRIRRVLNHMGGRDMTLCVALPHLLSFHARLQK